MDRQRVLGHVRATIFFHWKSIIVIIYSECVFVALNIQHAVRMCQIVFSDLPGSTKFFHIIS